MESKRVRHAVFHFLQSFACRVHNFAIMLTYVVKFCDLFSDEDRNEKIELARAIASARTSWTLVLETLVLEWLNVHPASSAATLRTIRRCSDCRWNPNLPKESCIRHHPVWKLLIAAVERDVRDQSWWLFFGRETGAPKEIAANVVLFFLTLFEKSVGRQRARHAGPPLRVHLGALRKKNPTLLITY